MPFSYTIREQLAQLGDPAGTTYPFSARYTYLANGTVGTSEFCNAGTPAAAKRYKYDYSLASYDALNRLKSADFSSWSGSAWTSTLAYDLANITYDLNGNLTALQRYKETAALVDNLTYTIAGTSNRLTSLADAVGVTADPWDAEAGAFTYDANGNQLTAPGPYSLTASVYDPRNLPLSFTKGGVTTTYRYDDGGQRITKQVGAGNTEVYLRDGSTTLGVFTVNAGGTVTSSFFNLHAGDRIVGRHPSVGSRVYYHTDMLGTTRAVVQGATVVESYDYDPWGVVLPGRTLGSGTKEGFTSKERDAESGLDYFGARLYASAFGRWNGVDRLGEEHPEWSVYAYVLNNPLGLIDPDGQQISAQAAKDFGRGVGSGVFTGVKGTVSGLVTTVSHPIQTASSLYALATEPAVRAQAANAIVAGVQERMDKLESGNAYQKGQVAGEILALVGEAVAGSKGVSAVSKGLRGTSVGAEAATMASQRTVQGAALAPTGGTVVYRSLNAAGEVQYIGITNNLARRAGEHATRFEIEKVMGGLSRSDARAVEQVLIEQHGLQSKGGTLLNKINSISQTSPRYAEQLQRGLDLLRSIGY